MKQSERKDKRCCDTVTENGHRRQKRSRCNEADCQRGRGVHLKLPSGPQTQTDERGSYYLYKKVNAACLLLIQLTKSYTRLRFYYIDVIFHICHQQSSSCALNQTNAALWSDFLKVIYGCEKRN